MSISWKVRVGGSVILAGLCLSSPFWSSGAWAQHARNGWAQSRAGTSKHPKAFALQPGPVQPAAAQPAPPTLAPVALPVTNPGSPLGSALASCDKASEGSEALALPGAKGEV